MKYLIIFSLLFLLFFPKQINAVGIYKAGTTGFDISFPQCPEYFPSDQYDFGIVGVNGGRAFIQNDCLFNEYFWAKKAKAKVSLYMNLNFPSGDTEILGLVGPMGDCIKNDIVCLAYNYGYNAAKDAYQYALSQFAVSNNWWVDVETANNWSDNVVLNNYVLQGTIDFLNSENVMVGIYSTKREWNIVMGDKFIPMQNFLLPVPNWIGTGLKEIDTSRCLKPFIPNSSVWIIQYAHGDFDGNYACV
ncbi:MAG TPA: hypothetical protein VLF89_01360 [Candidatus Saccharimonadales bacterium]|nr:hypothetical protein [Candidatus Saccharimonadales bacterium]